jgi:hypothetical protein
MLQRFPFSEPLSHQRALQRCPRHLTKLNVFELLSSKEQTDDLENLKSAYNKKYALLCSKIQKDARYSIAPKEITKLEVS